MNIICRPYKPLADFERVRQFLIHHHQQYNVNGNFYPSEWEYMHTHSLVPWEKLPRIGIWENEGEIVAVANFEWYLGEAFFQLNPHYVFLREELLDYAEKNFYGTDEDGSKFLRIPRLNSNDKEMKKILEKRGYVKQEWEEWIGFYDLTQEVPPCPLPEGFQILSLEEDNDLEKINRVMWRGFNHEGEPECGIDSRRVMQSGPHFDPHLNLVVKSPNGGYAVYCGMWYEPGTREAYLEPLCTDPDYRRMGLAKAALYEAMRRTQKMGAVNCIAGGQPFYDRVGFKEHYRNEDWKKVF